MKTIGLVMIVKNEGRSLEKCLSRVRWLVDEIYITDTGSTDNTLEIAKNIRHIFQNLNGETILPLQGIMLWLNHHVIGIWFWMQTNI